LSSLGRLVLVWGLAGSNLLLLLRLMMLLLIRLVHVLVEAAAPTALTTSTATLSSASASIVEFVVSSIATHEVSIVLILRVAHRLLMLHFVPIIILVRHFRLNHF
jgi:hypothetical protein